jgi:ribosomal-protein-alanine N-acetyltransferase
MTPFPIVTERLLLREFRLEDAAAINLYASDPEVTRHTSWETSPEHITSAILKMWIADQANWPRKSIPLGIELRSNGDFIGSTGFASIDDENSTGTFGFGLRKEYWGQGYASEAVQSLLGFAFHTLELHRMVAECFVENSASVRVLEKAGMRLEGRFRQNQRKGTGWRDSFLYAILSEERQH